MDNMEKSPSENVVRTVYRDKTKQEAATEVRARTLGRFNFKCAYKGKIKGLIE